MKMLITLILLIFSLTVMAQQMPNFRLQQVRIVDTDKTIRAELEPVKGKVKPQPMLYYFWYASNMIHSSQGGYSGQLLNGNYSEYYLNKSLKTQGAFKEGLKDGKWKEWNEAGILNNMISWYDGIKNGKFEIFDKTGAIIQSGNYHNNKLDGDLHFFEGPDSLRVIRYKNGKEVPAKPSVFKRINIFKKKTTSPLPHA